MRIRPARLRSSRSFSRRWLSFSSARSKRRRSPRNKKEYRVLLQLIALTVVAPASTKGLVLPLVPAVAPTFLERTQQLPSGELVGTNGPFVGISLQDAVAMALARNTDLAVSQSNVRIARFAIVA